MVLPEVTWTQTGVFSQQMVTGQTAAVAEGFAP